MATRKIKDAKDLSTQELIYFKGHAKATFMSDGATVEDAVRAVENATYKNKGYFPTLAELQSAFPEGSAGSRAYVGSTYPYSIYLWQNGAWVDSGATGGDESVDLASYYTKSETDTKLTELSGEIGDIRSDVVSFNGVEYKLYEYPFKKGQTITDFTGVNALIILFKDGTQQILTTDILPYEIEKDANRYSPSTAGAGTFTIKGAVFLQLEEQDKDIKELTREVSILSEDIENIASSIKTESLLEDNEEDITIVDNANEIIANINKDGVFVKHLTLQSGDKTIDVAKEIHELSTKEEKIKEESANNFSSALEITNDDETEVYVRLCEKGIFAKGIYDIDGNPYGVETAYKGRYWAVCGDSITNANHDYVDDIEDNDNAMPIDGYSQVSTYKRKNYAYYIAKNIGLKWANYGWGGTTLHICRPKAYETMEYAPFVDWRIEQLKEGVKWDYISIFFGWNDCTLGPVYQRDLWLQEKNGVDIGYPVYEWQIGSEGFANAAQKAECDLASGVVGGVEYTNNEQYFFAKFIGTINDTTRTTWMGAWNYALDYLMKKYPSAKFVIVIPYVAQFSQMVKDSVVAIAEKWGVPYFDFEDIPYWYYRRKPNHTPFANPHHSRGYWLTEGGITCEANIEGYNQARLSTDTLHPSNLGYRLLSSAFEKILLNK